MSDNRFLQPWTPGPDKDYTQNKRYSIGTHVLIPWSIDFDNPTLWLSQDNYPGDAQGGPSNIIAKSLKTSVYEWIVSYEGLDPSFNNVYYLSITNGKEGVTSHYFNISDEQTATDSSTTSAPTSTASATRLPTEPAATSTHTTKTSGGGIDSGAIAGITVGTVAGVLILAGWLWWWRRTKTRSNAGNAIGHPPSYKPKPTYEIAGNQIYEAPTIAEPPIYEADSTPVK